MTAAKAKALPATSPTFTVNARDFTTMLGNVLPFVGKDESLPMLTVVHLEAAGGKLTAATTDRYRFGTDRIDVDQTLAFDINLPAVHALHLIRLFRTRNAKANLDLTVTEGWLTAAQPTPLDGMPSVSAAYALLDCKFPPFRQFFDDEKYTTPVEGGAVFGLNSLFLADFAKVTPEYSGQHMTVTVVGPNKPIRIEIGTFAGLLMPVRIDQDPKK